MRTRELFSVVANVTAAPEISVVTTVSCTPGAAPGPTPVAAPASNDRAALNT